MQGALKYIEQNFKPNVQFSEIYYSKSVANGALDTRVELDYSDQKAIAILYHYFYTLGTPESAALNMTVQDQFVKEMFHVNRSSPGSNTICFPIPYVRMGSMVRIVIPANGAALIHFAISYQFLFDLPPDK